MGRKPEGDLSQDSADADARLGLLENLFQEAVRRAADLGFAGFFSTEEAVRRAFSERIPDEWLHYVNRQGDEVRAQIVEGVADAFREWLQSVDVEQVVRKTLADYDVRLEVRLGATPRDSAQVTPARAARRHEPDSSG